MRVIAKRYLTEGERNYKPGDEITDGQLFEQAEYYASLKQVEIVGQSPAQPRGESKSSKVSDPSVAALAAQALAEVEKQQAKEAKETKPRKRRVSKKSSAGKKAD